MPAGNGTGDGVCWAKTTFVLDAWGEPVRAKRFDVPKENGGAPMSKEDRMLRGTARRATKRRRTALWGWVVIVGGAKFANTMRVAGTRTTGRAGLLRRNMRDDVRRFRVFKRSRCGEVCGARIR